MKTEWDVETRREMEAWEEWDEQVDTVSANGLPWRQEKGAPAPARRVRKCSRQGGRGQPVLFPMASDHVSGCQRGAFFRVVFLLAYN